MRCLFCRLPLPTGAKFCSTCGNPSHFGPCDQCDAVNPREASRCWRCDHALAVEALPAPEASALPAYGDAIASRPRDAITLPVLAVRSQHAVALLPTPQRSISWQRMALPAALVALVAGVGLSALYQADEIPDSASSVPLAVTAPATQSDHPATLPSAIPAAAPIAPAPTAALPATADAPALDAAARASASDAGQARAAPKPATAARATSGKGTPARGSSRGTQRVAERTSAEKLEPARLPVLVQAQGVALAQPRERVQPAPPPVPVDASARCAEHTATLASCDLRALPKGN